MAQGLLDPDKFFAALYGHPDLNYEPMSGGRQMGAHFMTENIERLMLSSTYRVRGLANPNSTMLLINVIFLFLVIALRQGYY